MQTAVPDLMDIYGETATTSGSCTASIAELPDEGLRHAMPDRPPAGGPRSPFPRADLSEPDRWDQHGTSARPRRNARAVDQPIAALLKDLKGRGLLDHTLVVWAGEFGRTPFAQGANGRDHNQFGFTIWMAGGGVKGGTRRCDGRMGL